MSNRRRKKKHGNRVSNWLVNQKRVQRNVKDRLFRYLFENDREAGRSNEFLRSLSDRELQKKLFVEFGLEEE